MTNEEKRAAFQRLSHTPGIRSGQDCADSLLNKDRMQVGDLLEWTIDGEPGTILALSDLAIAIQWEETGIECSTHSGAVRLRVLNLSHSIPSCRLKP